MGGEGEDDIALESMVVGEMRDDDERDRGGNWVKIPLKGRLRCLCDFICCWSAGGEGSLVAHVPLVIYCSC